MIIELSNAPSDLTFDQLMRGDDKKAERELCRLFTPLKSCFVGKSNPALISQDEHVLIVTLVKTYGTDDLALLDTGAVKNLISTELAEQLHLTPKATCKQEDHRRRLFESRMHWKNSRSTNLVRNIDRTYRLFHRERRSSRPHHWHPRTDTPGCSD